MGAGRAWWHPGGVEGQPVRARAPRATRRLSAAAPRLPCASCTPRPHRAAEDGVRPAGRFGDVFQQDIYVATFKTKTNLGKPGPET